MHSKLERTKLIYTVMFLLETLYKIFGLGFLVLEYFGQRKLGVKLVKGIFKCFIIDVDFISCLTNMQGPNLSPFCVW